MMAQPENPTIEIVDNTLVVEFERLSTDTPVSIPADAVLDFNGLGNVIGIEILSLTHIAGSRVLEKFAGHRISYPDGTILTYDEEADAFSLQLTEERSLDQRAVECNILLDREGHLVALRVTLA